MVVAVTADFNKYISKLRDKKLLLAVKTALQRIESAHQLTRCTQFEKNTRNNPLFQIEDK
jgi:putative component of toxin-antitoxin plasmid stabilization module